MPTVLDYVRERDPRFKDVPDDKLSAYIKDRFPDLAKDLPEKKKLYGVSKRAAAQKAGIEVEQTHAQYAQDIANAKSQFVGDVSKAIPVAATLATGGMAAPLAIGVMGAAGAASGAYEEAAKVALGAEGAGENPKQLARRLGVDAALGAGTQAGLSIGGALLSAAGKTVLEPMVARAAAKVDQGKTILGTYGVKLLNKIRSADAAAGGPKISVQPELDALEARLTARKTGPSDAFKNMWGGMPGKQGALSPDKGGVATKLFIWSVEDGTASGLTEIKGELSQAAFKRAGFNFEERAALKEFADKIDKKLGDHFREMGAKPLYDGYKEVQDQLHRFNAGAELAGRALNHFAWRAGYITMGGGYGAYTGYQHGGGLAGAVTGAVAGAAAVTALQATVQKGAPLLLEKMLADKTARPLAQKAIGQMMVGDSQQATKTFIRAASQIGADKMLKNWLQEQPKEQPPEAPNAPQVR